MLWTNHRVMEWLRTIDLSEYASNLRGSGVHGALMVNLLHDCVLLLQYLCLIAILIWVLIFPVNDVAHFRVVWPRSKS